MRLKGTRVLVTGAGGFIGSHLVEELVHIGAKVRALVKYNSQNRWNNLEFLSAEILDQVEVIVGDIQDPYLVRKAVHGCQLVFHLAALISIPYSYRAPESFVNVNIKGTLNVLEASLQEHVERMVHTSTSEVYGSARYIPIDEEHPLQGQSPYSASKIGADKLAESYHLSFGLPLAIIRPFNTYGPRQFARAIIPAVACQVLSGAPRIMVGSQSPIRDFTFVKDTVRGFIQIAESEEAVGQVINIGSGKAISIGDLVRKIIELSGRSDIKVEVDPARIRPEESEVERLICNNAKARKILGWVSQYSLEQGLQETMDFIGKHLNQYKAELYNI